MSAWYELVSEVVYLCVEGWGRGGGGKTVTQLVLS